MKGVCRACKVIGTENGFVIDVTADDGRMKTFIADTYSEARRIVDGAFGVDRLRAGPPTMKPVVKFEGPISLGEHYTCTDCGMSGDWNGKCPIGNCRFEPPTQGTQAL